MLYDSIYINISRIYKYIDGKWIAFPPGPREGENESN
jgi:hypothetical protein